MVRFLGGLVLASLPIAVSAADDATLRYMYDHVLCVAESVRRIDDGKSDPEAVLIGVNALCAKQWDAVSRAIRTSDNARVREGLASWLAQRDQRIVETILATRAHRKP